MIKIVKDFHGLKVGEKEIKALTHYGKFTISDIFSTAFLHLLCSDLYLVRTDNIKLADRETIVYGIGEKEYTEPERENGVRYSAFGLLWKKYGLQYIKLSISPNDNDMVRYVFDEFDKHVVSSIDYIDNDEYYRDDILLTIRKIVDAFNIPRQPLDDPNEMFISACDFADDIITRMISQIMEERKYTNNRRKE